MKITLRNMFIAAFIFHWLFCQALPNGDISWELLLGGGENLWVGTLLT